MLNFRVKKIFNLNLKKTNNKIFLNILNKN